MADVQVILESWARIRTTFGMFDVAAFEFSSGREHLALVASGPELHNRPLVRLQSACLTGTAMLAELCDCRRQLLRSLELVHQTGSGCVVYLDQEGRGHGLVEKVAQLAEMNAGADTVDAAVRRSVPPDVRRYDEAAVVLARVVGSAPIRLLTNNPHKVGLVVDAGVDVVERVPVLTEPTPGNRAYLEVKKRRLGHLLDNV